MRRSITRFISALCILSLLLPITALATTTDEPMSVKLTNDEIVAYIEAYAKEVSPDGTDFRVVSSRKLKGIYGDKTYTLYSLMPEAFAVRDDSSGVIEELLFGTSDPYAIEPTTSGRVELYYGGPMNYIVRAGSTYTSVVDNRMLSTNDLAALGKREQSIAHGRGAAKALPTTTTNKYLSSYAYFTNDIGNHFGNNINGTCTHVACGIMLRFYDIYVNDLFVPTGYHCGSGTSEAFHQYLQIFLGDEACSIDDAAEGLNNYFDSIYFTQPTAHSIIGNHDAVYSKVTNNVSLNRPTVVAMFQSYNDACPIDHSVVVYGYREQLQGQDIVSASYYVHTGWMSAPLGVYSWDWFADALYID